MAEATDWSALWRQLVANQERTHNPEGLDNAWRERARHYAERVGRKWAQPDPIREFLIECVQSADTVLDIGAGTGSWAVPLARVARRVTALDPSAAVAEVKNKLGVADSVQHDDFLRDLLARRLAPIENGYAWPRAIQSVPVYWDVIA